MFPDVLAEVMIGELIRSCHDDTPPPDRARIHLYQLRPAGPARLPELLMWDAVLPQAPGPGAGVAAQVDALTAALAGRRADGAGLAPEEFNRLAGALHDNNEGLPVIAWLVSWPDTHAAAGASKDRRRAEAVDCDGRLYQANRHAGSPFVTAAIDEDPGSAPGLLHGVALAELLAATR